MLYLIDVMSPTRREVCRTINNSKILGYYHSLENHSNETSIQLLDEIWKEHADIVDNQSPNNGLDNFSGAINVLIPGKNLLRSCKNWKSNLSSLVEQLEYSSQCENNCNADISLNHMNKYLNNSHELPAHKTYNQKFNSNTNNNRENGNLPSHQSESLVPRTFTIPAEQKTASNISSKTEHHLRLKQPSNSETNKLENNEKPKAKVLFKTAKEQLLSTNPAAKRSLGTARKAPSKFISPMMSEKNDEPDAKDGITDERLKHIDPKMVELIQSEIIDNGTPIEWDDIAGLETAKTVIQEAVVWPMLRPDIFTGLRRPPKGVLLFGPPGTGKTLIGKCIASQCNATFFNISASSLTSKWIGDGEKMVRALFAVARTCQPAVVFVDEIDSLLIQRSDAEHEATRRIKTEFLVQFDGAGTGDEDRILIIGATNRPQELDEAARRRLVKRLYIPLPEFEARKQIVNNLMRTERNALSSADIDEICLMSEGYSGADMRSLCSEAAMGPIRCLPLSQIANVHTSQVRAVSMDDFKNALRRVRPSVSQDDLAQYVKWNATFGFDR